MSAFTINGQPIQAADLTVGRHGVWTGEVSAAGDITIADGARVTLVLGDTTFAGFKVCGGTFEGANSASFTVAGGAAGWAKVVPAKAYSIAGGVKLSKVATELATEAGERLDLGGIDRVLGDHWQRPAGPASVALSALFPLDAGGWRVDPDGFARPGVRPPAPLPAGLSLAVEDYSPARRWARLSLPEDNVGALFPGAVLVAPNLSAPLVVGETKIHASAGSVSVEVLGEGGIVELFAAILQALTPSRVFGGRWTYQVVDVDTGKPNLAALSVVAGLPPTLAADKVPGLPGATSILQQGALVVVAFRDGDPARPYVEGYIDGVLPDTVGITADRQIVLAAKTLVSLASPGRVNLGAPTVEIAAASTKLSSPAVELGNGAQVALATAAPISAWAANVNAALLALGHSIAGLGTIATANVKGS